MRSIREEDHHREIVPKKELPNPSEDKEHTTKPDVDGGGCNGETARALPAHLKDVSRASDEIGTCGLSATY